MMDHDGIMLNIATSPKTTNQPQQSTPKITKTQLKRIKYSKKIRNNTTSIQTFPKTTTNKNQSPNNVLQYPPQKQQFSKYQPKSDTSNKITSDQSKPRRKPRNPDIKSPALQKKKILKSTNFDITNIFKPQQQIEELMPEKMTQKSQKLDTNQIESLQLHPKLYQSLQKSNIKQLTDIQVQSYLPLYHDKVNAVIKANTGSGKTLAYLIPSINRFLNESTITKREDGLTMLIICPTRELCVQGQKQTLRCLKRMPYAVTGCLYGGQETNHEKARLRKGTNILFCTPGRVLYHLEHTKSFKLDNLKQIVFEQADRTLDMGFQQTVEKILTIIGERSALGYMQKILVSAHFNSKVSHLIESLEMGEPKFIGFSHKNIESSIKVEEGGVREQMTLDKLKHAKDIEINASQNLKQQYLLLSEDQKIPFLLAYVGLLVDSKVLIFVGTIDEVEFLDYLLNNLRYKDPNGVFTQIPLIKRPVYKIHGDLDQKLRSKTYLQFRQSKEAILISTQVASRGLDFPDLSHIILFDVPPSITDYGNRVGRSGRFNQSGVSLLMLHYQESDYAETIRYFCPDLQLVEKDLVFENYDSILKSINIGDNSMHYLEGLVRSSVKDDSQKYQLAKKAYVSMLRAYARLPDRKIFAVKKLNLKLLARTFGLNNAKAGGKQFNPRAKQSHLEASRKKRRVEDIKKLQVSEYL